MSAETVVRALSSAPEILEGIRSGLYNVWGGVVRVSKGHDGAGRIVGHLQFPGNGEQASEAISRLQQTLSGSGGLQESMGVLQNLQHANLALSGLNLAVSVAGFAIVCKKLNGISDQLGVQSEKLEQLLEIAVDAKAREELRDTARFRASLKTVRQFSELGDIAGLKSQVANLHEQYELTKLTLSRTTADVTRQGFLDSLDVIRSLQERMMYLGFLQSHVQQRTGASQFAVETLRELQSDWLTIDTVMVETIAANQEWLETLPQESGDNIVFFLKYRKEVAPAIEYQASLLEFTAGNPRAAELLDDEVMEIRFLAA
ncbi:hypothetical protein [Halopseudomonas sp.]|uniref:hypothetical protein n=1 Tax=Halopseudomonas sp. TaxID=2901191 RepID=UPI003001D916